MNTEWIVIARTISGSIDALIMVYTIVRALAFTGSNRYMRWALSTFAAVLTYAQFALIAAPTPLTSRTYVGWAGSVIVFVLFVMAVRSDIRTSEKRQ